MTYHCAECSQEITVHDDLVTVNVEGHSRPAHRVCPADVPSYTIVVWGESTAYICSLCSDLTQRRDKHTAWHERNSGETRAQHAAQRLRDTVDEHSKRTDCTDPDCLLHTSTHAVNSGKAETLEA